MEYQTSLQIQIPTFISCKSCGLWFSVDSYHHCFWCESTDMTIHNVVTHN